jgi:hypothetical protein
MMIRAGLSLFIATAVNHLVTTQPYATMLGFDLLFPFARDSAQFSSATPWTEARINETHQANLSEN